MKTCVQCGKLIAGAAYLGSLCQGCYRYFHDGGTANPIPPPGTIAKDHRGYVVCHICGRAYKRLGSHAKESHGMTAAEYKMKFGLCNNAKMTEAIYSDKMREYAYINNMPHRLQVAGEATRIKNGERHLRYGKKSRLQECLGRSKKFGSGD